MPRRSRSTPRPRRYDQTVIDYFWAHVNDNGPIQSTPDLGPCMLWTGPLSKPENYPRLRHRGLDLDAGRWAFRLFRGSIPSGRPVLDHLCHSWASYCAGGVTCPHRPCVHPMHREPVTPRENRRRVRTPNPYARDKLPPQVMWRTCRNGHPWSKETIVYVDGLRACGDCEDGLY